MYEYTESPANSSVCLIVYRGLVFYCSFTVAYDTDKLQKRTCDRRIVSQR